MENNLASLLRDFAQGASNSAATNLSIPVDAIAWLLRKGGMNIPNNPVGGSDWMAEKGFTPEPKNKLAGLLGDVAGFAAPLAAVSKASQIAKGLLQMGDAMPMGSKGIPALSKASPMADRGAIVWHGSPHKFDAFDSSKIGTGEGAQAYGHGLYLAESPDVAKSYQALAVKTPTLSLDGQLLKDHPNDYFKKFESNVSNRLSGLSHPGFDDLETAIKNANDGVPREIFSNLSKQFKSGRLSYDAGQLYKVDLPDEHIAKMLDWDKPLSQQTPDVQSAVTNYFALSGKEHYLPKGQNMPVVVGEGISGDTTGKQFYEYLRGKKGEQGAAEALRWGDVPGIKYLDGGSRTAGQGSSNYVVFPGNERLLKILERNGQKP